MRHRLVRVYWGVNLNMVYEVVVRDLPSLITATEQGIVGCPLPDGSVG